MIGISFFLLNNVFGYLGNLGNWWPWITAAAPGLIYRHALAAFTLAGAEALAVQARCTRGMVVRARIARRTLARARGGRGAAGGAHSTPRPGSSARTSSW